MLFSRDITKPWIRSETPAAKKRRAALILKRLERAYPNAKIALKYQTPMQLLAAVIMSAQATDKKVNEITQTLFRKYRTADDFAGLDPRKLAQEIHAIGFYRAKALAIVTSARIIRWASEVMFGSETGTTSMRPSKSARMIIFSPPLTGNG